MGKPHIASSTRLILISTGVLALFAFLSILPVSGLQQLTRERIAINLQAARLNSIAEVLDGVEFDNDILSDQLLDIPATLETHNIEVVAIYLVKMQQQLVATVFEVITRKGYSGSIRIIIGINATETVIGVRILEHRETPGLGDAIDTSHSNWVLGFNKKSLNRPSRNHWAVKKDGGTFDQLTGATISPRAVVNAVKQTLIVYNQNRVLFDRNSVKNGSSVIK